MIPTSQTPTLAEMAPVSKDDTESPISPSTKKETGRPDSIDIDLEAPADHNKVKENHAVDDAFPEGGKGWVVVLGVSPLRRHVLDSS